MNSRETKRIRIYRKENGCVLVDPGLAILKSDTDFDVVNTTDRGRCRGLRCGGVQAGERR
jgi:hypothetical protein